MFKEHKLYKFYEIWIDLKDKSLSYKKLMKISETNFIEFVQRYENSSEFKSRIDDIMIQEIRDVKLDNILDDDDFFGTI